MAGRASLSTSSSFSYGFTYDVFLSFRGEDTRHGFTGNLYKALHDRGIHTFIDDKELQRGEQITPSLVKAIEESRIAITVLSNNYASSSFCLDELSKIIECIEGKGRLVLPVFYDVDPSHVRHQRGSYGEAMARHEEKFKDNMEKVQNWRKALEQVANLSGEHFEGKEYEHEFIGKIVKVVSNKINRAPLYVADYPVGLESRVLQVKSLLDVGSDDVVHMVGIHGMGGIGKTALARAVYNLIADQFEGLCFLGDVREKSKKHGLEHLQEMLLSKIVGEKDIKLADVCEGIPKIEHRLHRKKVLLILDDVDEPEQLRALVRGSDRFGPGSRVIITTRDKHLLVRHRVERTYELEVLSEKEALDLLIWKAFKSDKVLDQSHMDILNRAVTYASGLPLALEVIGSNLFGKSIEEWKSALDLYARFPNEDIQKILKVSFDALEGYQKRVFLDIACFFKGYELAEVESILYYYYGFCPKFGIGVLVEKSLIKIQEDRMTLHDLIEDMGREIVRQESREKPGERSRLGCLEDVVQVLEDNTGTCKIEIIVMDFPNSEEVNWDGEAFKKMENLKTLVIRNGRFSEGLKHLPNSLRVLIWWEYPSESLPSDFHPTKLVILQMRNSHLRSLGLLETWKKFVNLRVLQFDYCEYITEIPNVSGFPNLKGLQFSYCENLIKIHESIGFLDKLVILNLRGCSKLRSFPPIKLISLQFLDLSFCSSFENFPEILGEMENIEFLFVGHTPIKEFPSSIQKLTGLEIFFIDGCQMLQLPRSIPMLPGLKVLTLEKCHMSGSFKQHKGEKQVSSNVERLEFKDCKLTDECIPIILPYFPKVKELDLSGSNFTILPACIEVCSFLTVLNLNGCTLLREIEEIPPNIEILVATNCPSLTSKSRSMLLNKELHEKGGNKKFHLDGTNIPEWFEHPIMEWPISFWFRNKFPAISLCVVVDEQQYGSGHWGWPEPWRHPGPPVIWINLIVNGNQVLCKPNFCSEISGVGNRTIIFDRKQIKFEDNVDEVLIKNEWNRVVFTFEITDPLVIKQSGIHVFKQSSMEDIRFIDPMLLKEEHRSDTGDSQRQFMQQPKKDNVNWDSNLMVSTCISSAPSVQGCEESHIITLDKETNELYSSPKVISDSDSIMSSCNSDIDGGNGGLPEQQHLTFMDQQNFDGYESVNKAKGKEMVSLAVACNSNVGEDNDTSSLIQQLSMTKVTSEKYQPPSYDKAMV